MNYKTVSLFFTAMILASCALTPTQEEQINAIAGAVAPVVQAYAETGHVSYAQAIPAALNSIAVFAPSAQVDTTQLSSTIESTVSAFTANTSGSTGQKIASAVLVALPAAPNGAQTNAALTQAGIGASIGANP